MSTYDVTEADRRPIPSTYANEPRYLGYREVDSSRPYRTTTASKLAQSRTTCALRFLLAWPQQSTHTK